MKYTFLLLAVLFEIIFQSSSIAQIKFQKSFGDAGFNYGSVVRESSSGGYLLCGVMSDSAGNNDILVVRTDQYGDTLWTRIFGTFQNEEVHGMVENDINEVTLSGYTNSEIFLVKLNFSGTVQWNRTFGLSSLEGGKSLIETQNGGYAFTASLPDSGKWKTALIKTDFSGNTEWIKRYGSSFGAEGKGLIQAPDGGFIITGDVDEQLFSTQTDYFVIRTDLNGDTLWTRSYGFTGATDNAHSVIFVPGGYVVAGFTGGGPNGADLFLHRLDESGNLVWAKTYLGTTFSSLPYSKHMSVEPANDGGYFFTGKQMTGLNFSIFKTDSSGNLLWSRGSVDPYAQAMHGVATQDGGYVATGAGMFTPQGLNLVLLKTDSLGWSGCAEQNINAPSSPLIPLPKNYPFYVTVVTDTYVPSVMNVYSGCDTTTVCISTGIEVLGPDTKILIAPNPFTSSFTISGIVPGSEIEVFDVSGKRILHKFSQTETEVIDADSWCNGCYVIKITSDSSVFIQKLIK